MESIKEAFVRGFMKEAMKGGEYLNQISRQGKANPELGKSLLGAIPGAAASIVPQVMNVPAPGAGTAIGTLTRFIRNPDRVRLRNQGYLPQDAGVGSSGLSGMVDDYMKAQKTRGFLGRTVNKFMNPISSIGAIGKPEVTADQMAAMRDGVQSINPIPQLASN